MTGVARERHGLHRARRITGGMLVLGVWAGCTVGPDFEPPDAPAPAAYRDSVASGESVANVPWWNAFEDTVLTGLIGTALENNRDLRTAVARIEESRAAMGIVRAQLYPSVDYGGNATASGNTETEDVDLTGLFAVRASYELDLWGRIRRSNEAALNELLATEEAYRALTIGLVSQVATTYLQLRDLDNRQRIAEQTLEAWQGSYDVIRVRYEAGMVTEVDLNQSEIQVTEAEASVHSFERLRGQTENALSVLVGGFPQSIPRGKSLAEQTVAPDMPPGLPSELLSRRPDVRQAERRLHAQTARIGATQALRYPRFDLLGDIGAQFGENGAIGFFDLGAQVLGPIFDGGEIGSRVDSERAKTEQLLNQYESAVLNAYREVEDALVAVRTYRAEYEARERQTRAAGNAARLAWVRYDGGLTSYLEVLDLQRSLFNSELRASQTLQLGLTSYVQLYAALGGGWTAEQDTIGIFEANR